MVGIPSGTSGVADARLTPSRQFSSEGDLTASSDKPKADPRQSAAPPESELLQFFASSEPVYDEPKESPAQATAGNVPDEVESVAVELPKSQAEAIVWLEQLGARLTRDFDDEVRKLDLSYRQISDRECQVLQFFPNLTELDLTGTDITDAAMANVVSLKKLHSLKLKGTAVTAEGILQIPGMASLRLVDLGHTTVTDAALSHLSALGQLEYLLLNHTTISDAGLQHVASMRTLRGLNLVGSAVTEEGLARLKRSLPQCLVVSKPSKDLSSISLPSEFHVVATQEALQDESDEKLRRVLQLVHEDPSLAKNLAAVYAEQGELRKSAAILRVAVRARPNDAMLNVTLAEALARVGQTEEAYKLFRQYSDESNANFAVGSVLYRSALSTSVEYLERSVAANGNNLDALRKLDEVKQRQRVSHASAESQDVFPADPTPQITPRSAVEETSPNERIRRLPVSPASWSMQ